MAEIKLDSNGGRATMFQFALTVVLFALGLSLIAVFAGNTFPSDHSGAMAAQTSTSK